MPELRSVTCLMLTKDRPEMARHAVECFRRQTYANRSLVIYDTGNEDLLDQMDYPSIIWIPEDSRGRTIGELRNAANSHTSGVEVDLSKADASEFGTDIIIHWDDDDYSAPDRIAQQVRALQESGADVVGYHSMTFWREGDGEAWQYSKRLNQQLYALGTSLCYWRTTWEKRQFRATSHGEDLDFIRGRKLVSCDAGDMMVARIHAANTSSAYGRKAMERSPEWARVPDRDDFCRRIFA